MTSDLFRKYIDIIQEQSGKALSVDELATISDEALDRVYHYGRSTPGNSFGWQANLMSAEYAKKMIDAGETDIEKIADLQLKQLAARLESKEIQLKFKPGIKKLLVEKGYDIENGARPMKRAVQRIIEDKLAGQIVEGLIKPGDVAEIDARGDEAEIRVKAGAAIK